MSLLDIAGSIVSGILGGGATGILGAIAQRFADYKNRQLDIQLEAQKFNHAVELRKLDAEIAVQEAAAKLEIVKTETAGATDVADAQAFAASYNLEPKRYSSEKLSVGQQWIMVLLDAFRGSIRPALTAYLCVLVTYIWIEAKTALQQEDLTNEQALELFKLMLGTICYVWTTITLWWFGTRNKGKQPN